MKHKKVSDELKKLRKENNELRSALTRIKLYSPLYKDDPWPKIIAEQALNKIS